MGDRTGEVGDTAAGVTRQQPWHGFRFLTGSHKLSTDLSTHLRKGARARESGVGDGASEVGDAAANMTHRLIHRVIHRLMFGGR